MGKIVKTVLLLASALAPMLASLSAFGASEPAILAEKAVFWLDASKPETILTNETGGVTNWISRDANHKVATAAFADFLPQYEPTKYGQVCVDFGDVNSSNDLHYASVNYTHIFQCVKIRQNALAFMLGGSSLCMHRGIGGTWMYQSDSYTKIKSAWQDGVAVVGFTSTLVPEDDFYVFSIKATGTCSSDMLTQDRTFVDRTGGRQLSELILINDSKLSDDNISTITQYLLRKWKLDPNVTVSGTPAARGTVSPEYGTYYDFVKGETYTFRAPAAMTNDSHSFKSTLTGWNLVKTDFSSESGTGGETSFVYDDSTSYATLNWGWSDWSRVPLDRGAYLPRGYRCLQYVEQGPAVNGKLALINTGIVLNERTTDVLFTVGASDTCDYTTDVRWIGNFKSNNESRNKATFCLGRYQSKWRTLDGSINWLSPNIYPNARNAMTVVLTDGMWKFLDPDSETKWSNLSNASDCTGKPEAAAPIGLFAEGGLCSKGGCPVGGRIYQVETYEGATCTHKLVGARRVSDGKIGFYDVVTDTFLTNTVGTLIGGPRDRRYIKGFAIVVQ